MPLYAPYAYDNVALDYDGVGGLCCISSPRKFLVRVVGCISVGLILAGSVMIGLAMTSKRMDIVPASVGLEIMGESLQAWKPGNAEFDAFKEAKFNVQVVYYENATPDYVNKTFPVQQVLWHELEGLKDDQLLPMFVWDEKDAEIELLDLMATENVPVLRYELDAEILEPMRFSKTAAINVKIVNGDNGHVVDETGHVPLFQYGEYVKEENYEPMSKESCRTKYGGLLESNLCFTFKVLDGLCLRVTRSENQTFKLTHDLGYFGCQWATLQQGSPARYEMLEVKGNRRNPTSEPHSFSKFQVAIMSNEDPLLRRHELIRQGKLGQTELTTMDDHELKGYGIICLVLGFVLMVYPCANYVFVEIPKRSKVNYQFDRIEYYSGKDDQI